MVWQILLGFSFLFSGTVDAQQGILFYSKPVYFSSWNSSLPTNITGVSTLRGCLSFCSKNSAICNAFAFSSVNICSVTIGTSFVYYPKTGPTIKIWYNPSVVTVSEAETNDLYVGEYLLVDQYLTSSTGCFRLQISNEGYLDIVRTSTNLVARRLSNSQGTPTYFFKLSANGCSQILSGSGLFYSWCSYAAIYSLGFTTNGRILHFDSKGSILYTLSGIFYSCN